MGERRSVLGSYAGYVEAIANGYQRTSQYVQVRDGCRLAIDALHPAMNGVRLGGARPTVVRGTGYRRSFERGEIIRYDISRIKIIEKYPVGTTITPYEFNPLATALVNHGYNFVSVDLRGTGASFGRAYDQPVTIRSGQDLADVIDWIAQQSWSDGKIGMWGRSWEGRVQIATGIVGTKNLTCLCVMAAGGTLEVTMHNGLYARGFRKGYDALRRAQDEEEVALPVDGPDGPRLLAEARSLRERVRANDAGTEEGERITAEEYSRAWIQRTLAAGGQPERERGRPRTIEESYDRLNANGTAIYWFQGWWDLTHTNVALSQFHDLTVPKKLLIGPWTHSQFAFVAEPMRWFDYWLKGMDNGIMDEPPVAYSTTQVDGSMQWRAASKLFSDHPKTTFYLAVDEGEDPRTSGRLNVELPRSRQITYTVDYDVSTGSQTRTTYLWKSVQLNYDSGKDRTGRVLTFDTTPFPNTVRLTGIPTLRLSLSTTASDGGVFALLEQIEPSGNAHYLTEGLLNLAHHRCEEARFGYLGEGWHPTFLSEGAPVVPGAPMAVVLDLCAIAVLVPAGHRLRLTISGADAENYTVPRHRPAPSLTIALGGSSPARLALPIIAERKLDAEITGAFVDDAAPYAFEHTGGS